MQLRHLKVSLRGKKNPVNFANFPHSQVETGHLATSALVLQCRTGKRTEINPRTRLIVLFFFFMTLCVSCCSVSGPMCVACQTTAAHRHVVWSEQGKASGAHVERNVLVQLQTWQPGAPLLLHPDRWFPENRHNRGSLVRIKLPKNRIICQHGGVHPLILWENTRPNPKS